MNRIDCERPCSIVCLLGVCILASKFGEGAALLDTYHWSRLKPESLRSVLEDHFIILHPALLVILFNIDMYFTDTNKKSVEYFFGSSKFNVIGSVKIIIPYVSGDLQSRKFIITVTVDSEVVHLVFLLHFEELAKDASLN